VQVSDVNSGTDTQTIAVAVTDINEVVSVAPIAQNDSGPIRTAQALVPTWGTSDSSDITQDVFCGRPFRPCSAA
jgi:hypothetical protein